MYKYLKLFPVILLGLNFSASAQSVLFSYTGAVQNYVVPAGCTSVNIIAEGANGAACVGNFSQGGIGGRSVCDMTVTPGQTLYIYVGGSGASGGYNGGGNALAGNGGMGGGASDVRTGTGLALSDRVIVAGGGGGAGYDCAAATNFNRGGQGGGLTAETGYLNSLFPLSSYAYGGDQVGASGGSPGVGTNAIGNGGGGGGGYYGGLPGTNTGPGLNTPACAGGYGGAGGGSSYGDLSVLSSATHNIGGNTTITGNGSVTICAPGVAGTIKANDSLCVGTVQTLSDAGGTPGGTWTVTSAGGTATINAITGDINPTAAGMVIIKYDVVTPCGNATATRYMMVRDYPSAIAGILSTCTNASTTLSDPTIGGTWTSSNTPVATVGSSNGTVNGVTAGTSIISYSDNGCAVGAIVTVIQGPDTIIGPDNVCVAGSVQFSDATPGGTWSTNALPSQATMNSSTGVLTGVSSGPIVIYYTVGSCFSSKVIMVSDPPGAIFGSNTLCAGSTTTLLEFGFGGSWSARFPLVADVDPGGTVTAYSGGPDTIYYTVPGCPPAEFPMAIDQAGPIMGITSVCKGTSIPLTDTSVGGIWTSSDTDIAIIDSFTGQLRDGALATVGSTATITFTVPAGCFSTLNVTVNTSAPPITGPDTVCQGATAALTDAATGGTWSSTDLSIAQIVDTSGIVSGISAGIVNVSYTLYSGCYAARSFRVKPLINALTGLIRTPMNDTICEGTPVHIYANPAFAGSGPSFVWSLFGVVKGTTDTFDYTPKHGDVIVVEMTVGTGVCATSGVVKDSITYDVDSIKAPTISIALGSPSSDTLKYLGQEFTFNSTVHYGGENAKYQWYRNGKLIPGATNIYYKAEVYYTDTFFCIVNGNPPCTAPSNVASNGIIIYNFLYKLDTKTISNAGTTLSLFPNPTRGTLTLTGTVAGNTNEDVNIEISDMLGRIVYSGSTAPVNGKLNKEIVLNSNIADGTYMMRVNTANESNVIHFVVNK
ncbi:MAG: surface protein [Flavipsychrobacter sp.]|nr:surface protein [Flavipsychrobacter sp.]